MNNDIRSELITVLSEAGEDGLTLPALSTALDMPKSAIQPVLNDLVSRMAIRNTQGLRNVRYWVPSQSRLDAEARLSEVRVTPPLKVDRARKELYERISAERNSVRSIG